MSKSTPGPWAFTENNGEPWICSDTEEGGLICPKPDNEANAQAIAALPELVEALKQIVWKVDQTQGYKAMREDVVIHLAKQVLAKVNQE